VQNQEARAAVLASLAAVDAVVIFDEDTPVELITQLKPDLLVKGADYRLDQVVGADIVKAYGGRVMLAPIVPGFSTTATIARAAR
jgi:D-beta-D-heptose 7-phosphate kinase / D-beta-D-heptose 1-phosphate adenosyltransferase